MPVCAFVVIRSATRHARRSEVERVGRPASAARRIHAPAFPHPVAESVALLRRHVIPASPSSRAATAVDAEPPEENATEGEEAKCLPEGDLRRAKKGWQQPIP